MEILIVFKIWQKTKQVSKKEGLRKVKVDMIHTKGPWVWDWSSRIGGICKVHASDLKYTVLRVKVYGHFENTYWSLNWNYTVCKNIRFTKNWKVNYTVFCGNSCDSGSRDLCGINYAEFGKLVAVAISWQTCGEDQFMPRDSGKLTRGFALFEFFIRCTMEDPNWILL